MSPKLAGAYRRAPYRIGGVAFRIGQRSRQLDALLRSLGVREAGLVTAANPGRRMPKGWNDRAMRRLLAYWHRAWFLAAESGAGRWREPQLLASPLRPLLVLGRRFRQNAAVRLRLAAPPELVSLR